ncbi:hypothetical protein RDI58_024013 [Solanum bulbocastanum]|uniref:Transmembrane protein n=1 Tax=Solanum bulbocastanum TaxID=147425 RepID=A0AAN8Y363_SOLBU
MGGGVILTWWSSKFHTSNRQLWMVPLGLILVVTPIIICLAILLESYNHREIDDHHNLECVSKDSSQDLERPF